MTATTLGYAFLGGLLPSLIWLHFLLKEDATHPEPKQIIVYAFLAGMLAVPIALYAELYTKGYLTDTLSVLTAWALIEEVLKYAMAAFFILWRHAVDEAPDYVIYMITVALGFAAAETMLFIYAGSNGNLITGSIISDTRFLGATLLHITASGVLGFAFAFSSMKGPLWRIIASASGLILAVALHTAFNMLIINTGTSTTFAAFFLVWMVAIVFFATFEVLKYFQYRNS